MAREADEDAREALRVQRLRELRAAWERGQRARTLQANQSVADVKSQAKWNHKAMCKAFAR